MARAVAVGAFVASFVAAGSGPALTEIKLRPNEVAPRASELKLTSSVRSGVQSVLAFVRIWDANCDPLPVNVAITSPPLNGVALVKAGLGALPEHGPRAESAGNCAGAIVIGKHVMYRSNPGFHGLDRVSYDAVNANGKKVSTIVTITVR